MNLGNAALVDLQKGADLLHGKVLAVVQQNDAARARRKLFDGTEQELERLFAFLDDVGHPIGCRGRLPVAPAEIIVQSFREFMVMGGGSEQLPVPADPINIDTERVAQFFVSGQALEAKAEVAGLKFDSSLPAAQAARRAIEAAQHIQDFTADPVARVDRKRNIALAPVRTPGAEKAEIAGLDNVIDLNGGVAGNAGEDLPCDQADKVILVLFGVDVGRRSGMRPGSG